MKCFTGYSVYLQYAPAKRGDIVYDAQKLFTQCELIRQTGIKVLIINNAINISLSGIDCSGMTEPRHEKYEYYKDYYKETGCVPHDILIDENNQIVDGYISLLVTNKYGKSMSSWQRLYVYRVNSSVPHKKIVIGRHVNVSESDVSIRGQQYFMVI